MKFTFSHKKPILVGGGILIVISIFLLLFTTCDIGLGQIVNTKAPVIKNSGDNLPGAFLHGKENKIVLDVSNELGFKIDEVFVEIEYFDLATQSARVMTSWSQVDKLYTATTCVLREVTVNGFLYGREEISYRNMR